LIYQVDTEQILELWADENKSTAHFWAPVNRLNRNIGQPSKSLAQIHVEEKKEEFYVV
jgi:hypothetical protein